MVIEIGSFLSGFTNPMSFFEGCRLRLYSRKFFQNPCRFSALNVAVRGWREKTRIVLRQTEDHRRKRDAKTLSEKMSFWRPEGCGKGMRGVFTIEIGSVLAPSANENQKLAPFWRQKADTKTVFSRMALILMPLKEYFPLILIFSAFP